MKIRAALGGILLALFMALPASAADVVLVTHGLDYANGKGTLWQSHVIKVLNALGIQYDRVFLPVPTAAVMESLEVGSLQIDPVIGTWKRYRAVIFAGMTNGQTFDRGPGYSIDFFTSTKGPSNSRYPPTVPFLIIGDPAVNASLDGTAACSTGVDNQAVNSARDSTHLAYAPGLGRSWRHARANCHLRLPGFPYPLRALVAYTAGRFTERPVADCQDCYNDLGGTADTLIAWEVDYTYGGVPIRQTISGVSKALSSIIFVSPGGTPDGTMMTLLPALARLDSLSGGAVFAGATGRRIALGVQGAANLATDSWGSYVADTAAVFPASMDSLDALGVPYSLQVSPVADSLARAYRWFNHLTNARFTPGDCGQVNTLGANPGNADLASNPVDPIARNRSRHVWTGSATDTSITNILKAGADLVSARFGPQRTDRVFTFPRWVSDFRSGTAHADSLKAALAQAGYTGMVYWWRSEPATDINELGPGGSQFGGARQWMWTDPTTDFGAGRKRLRLLSAGSSTFEYNGRLVFGIDAGNFDQPLNIMSYDTGSDRVRKYLPDSGIDWWAIEAGCFGSRSNDFLGGTPYVRSGYYHFKWLVNAIRATDAMCWPGNRCPLRIVTLTEMAGTNP